MSVVLYVDDDETNRLLMTRVFAHHRPNDQLVTASSAAEARKEVRRQRPDLVVLDLTLGEDSGEELLTSFKLEYGMPVIIFSGHADTDTTRRLLDMGADAFVTKPIEVESLIRAIEEFIGSG